MNPTNYFTTPHPLQTVHTISHIHYKHYSTPASNTTIYYEYVAEHEPEVPGWEVIDLSLLLYWPAAIFNIILMVVIIARPSLRRRPNSPVLVTICLINIIIVIHIFVSHFHRYSFPVYLKMKGLCELITVIAAVMRVFTPYVYILMAAERFYTLGTSRIMALPTMRMRHSFMLLGTLFLATLIIALTGIMGISGGFYYDYTMDGDYVCFVAFNKAGYYFYTTMLFLIPDLIMFWMQILLILTYFRYKYGMMQNAPVRMRETEARDGSPLDNGYSNEAGSPDPTPSATDTTPAPDNAFQIDSVTEEVQGDDNFGNLRQMALVAWVSLLVFFLSWTLQLILHYISWYSAHYVGRVAEHVLNVFLILYPLTWLILDLEIRASYRGVCCICLPRRTSQDDEERLI